MYAKNINNSTLRVDISNSLIAVLRDSSFVDVGQRDRTGIGVSCNLYNECVHGLYVYIV